MYMSMIMIDDNDEWSMAIVKIIDIDNLDMTAVGFIHFGVVYTTYSRYFCGWCNRDPIYHKSSKHFCSNDNHDKNHDQ